MNKEVNLMSINTIDLGREYCPEAVTEWCNGTSDYSRQLSEKVKKHLAFKGWVFWYPKHRHELRYQSPRGKVYYSLVSACQGFLLEEQQKGLLDVHQHHETDLGERFEFKGRGRPRNNSNLNPKQPKPQTSLGKILKPAISRGKILKPAISRGRGRPILKPAISRGKILKIKGKCRGRPRKDSDFNPKQPRKRKALSQPNPQKRQKRQKRSDKPINYCEMDLEQSPLPGTSDVGVSSQPNSSALSSKCILSKLVDSNAVALLSKVYYRDTNGIPLKTGVITRDGIQCDCCSRVFALSTFESHAGSTKHRPAANIMLDDGSGRSLSDCKTKFLESTKTNSSSGQVRGSIIKSSKKKSITRKKSPRSAKDNPRQESDGICSICQKDNDEDLMYCDRCPSVFHASCLGVKKIQERHWVCPSCCCTICGNGNLSDDDDSLLTCQQCERQFHVSCCTGVKKPIQLKTPHENELWFCGHSCDQVFSGLQMLTGKPIALGNNVTWTLLKSTESNAPTAEHKKLRLALDVLHECFEPSKDIYTGRDMTKDMIFGRESKLKRINFKGFYTVILEKDDDAATVATLRVFGNKVAEIPLVGTRFKHRKQGLCRLLVDELEKHLTNIGVKKLVLPSVDSTLDTWTKNFGFSQMTDEDRSKLLQYTILDFQGTIMCQKLLKKRKD